MLPSPVPDAGDPRAAAFFRPFPHHLPPSPPSKTMEDVWKDIDLHEVYVPQPNPSSAAAPPPPATALSLNSGPGFYFPADDRPDEDSPGGDGNHPFDALASSALSSFGKKRLPEGGNGDRRYKRMMKNRESAARSRARKQAYMNGLQLKIGHLKEENDKLKEQYKKLMLLQAEPVPEHPKKQAFQRASTAPF